MTAPRGGVRGFVASYWTPAGRHALRNLVGLVACTGVSQACGLGVLLILTHGLSQAAFGAVMLALNVQTYLITVGTFGLSAVVVRDLAQEPDKADEIVTAYLTIVAAASLLSGAVVAASAAVLPLSGDERVMLWCVSAGNVFACLNLNPLFDAMHRQALAAALMVPADVLALAATAGLSATGRLTAATAGLVLLGKWALTAFVQFFAYRLAVYPLRVRACNVTRHRMVRSGGPLLVAAGMSMLPLQGGVLATRIRLGSDSAALYGLAFQTMLVYLLLASLVIRVVQPHIVGEHGLARRFVLKLIVLSCFTFGSLWAAGVFAGWLLTHHFLPMAYTSAFGPMTLLLTAAVLVVGGSLSNVYLLRLGGERPVVLLSSSTGVAFLAGVAIVSPDSPTGFAAVLVGVSGFSALCSAAAAWALGGRSAA